jgi:hypothetical protein
MRHLPYVACVALPCLLAACGGGDQQDALPVAFPAAPLPMFSPGDSYSFDDGTVDTVVATANNEVRWHNATGARFVTSRDVLLPPLSWSDATQSGRRSYAAGAPLFPLQPGGGVTAAATITLRPSNGGRGASGQENWQCQVGDAQRIRVAVGWFDTVRVDCAVTQMPSGQYEQRSFFYAPSIGYYVRRVDRIGDGPPRTVQLTAWTDGNPPLPDSALQQRVSAIQSALESQASGTAVHWQDPATEITGSVAPTQTVRGGDGGLCRDFEEHLSAFGRRYALTGEACRETVGDWQVINVGPFGAG